MITNNIIRYLKNEDSVILNRLGSFSKKRVPSVVEGDMILPPKVILDFKYFEDGNGFSIIDKISQWESKRLIDADDIINQWVVDLKTSLQNNKNVVFENFGTFYLNNVHEICFDSFVIKELNGEYLGMNPVPITKPNLPDETTPLTENIATTNEIEATKLEPIEQDVVEEEVIEQPIIEQPVIEKGIIEQEVVKEEVVEEEIVEQEVVEEEIDEEAPIKKKRSYWGTFVFVLVILGAIAVILLLFKDPILDFYNTKVKSVEKVIPQSTPIINEADQINTDVDTKQEVIQENTTPEPAPIVPQVTKPVENQQSTSKNVYPLIPMAQGKFYVIAGSFTKESDALKHIKDKKLEIYNPILITGQSRIRVCIGTFNSENEALAFVNKVDKTYWVLK